MIILFWRITSAGGNGIDSPHGRGNLQKNNEKWRVSGVLREGKCLAENRLITEVTQYYFLSRKGYTSVWAEKASA